MKSSDNLTPDEMIEVMARGLRAIEGLKAKSPGLDSEKQQWQRWYDEALAIAISRCK